MVIPLLQRIRDRQRINRRRASGALGEFKARYLGRHGGPRTESRIGRLTGALGPPYPCFPARRDDAIKAGRVGFPAVTVGVGFNAFISVSVSIM